MKSYKACFLVLALTFASVSAFSQSPAPVAAAAAPVAAPTVASAPAIHVVSVAEPAAPPKWAEDVIVSAQKLPVVGPVVSKALLYAGIVSSILTALVGCLLTILSALSGVLNVAGLAAFAEKVSLFKNGKIMYWLSYLSMFNAKKPEDGKASGDAQAEPPAAA